ncbi:MAG: OmpH family outer membrane protein [Desulfovibrio sp.]|nr:OmpH family outer membrane protein [Desulfovibrio sp.]
MRRLFMASVLAASFLFSGIAQANELKVGIVDVQSVVMECDMANTIKNHMKKKYGKEREQLEKQSEQLKMKAEELKNPKIGEKKRVEFIRQKQKFDQKYRTLMQKAEQEQVTYNQKLVTQIFAAAKRVAEKKGFNLILDVGQGGVLYADTAMNLTDDVLTELNNYAKEHKIDLK